MRTRNAGTPKSAAAKKTPPAKKSAVPAETTPNPTAEDGTASATPNSNETKRASVAKAKHAKSNDTTHIASTDSKPESSVEETKASGEETKAQAKIVSRTKTSVKKTPGRTKADTGKAVLVQTPKSDEVVKENVEEFTNMEEIEAAKDEEPTKKEELGVAIRESVEKEQSGLEVEEPSNKNAGDSGILEEPVVVNVEKSLEAEEANAVEEETVAKLEVAKEVTKAPEDKAELKVEPTTMEGDGTEELEGEDVNPDKNKDSVDEGLEECGDQEVIEEPGEEVLAEDGVAVPGEEADPLEEEHIELTTHAKERKIKKELEIFVGGLDRDAVEDDLKNAFEKVGEVVEVRLHRDASNNKNKGYAFVKFANKEQASRALLEMKNPVIHGKRCGTAPSEDNDTLFLGNICNTWTKEAIKQKLKDYGIEGVENITLVPDAQHEGLSRGFAFLEFACHADAMLAYKRLQKSDAIFGHTERTAKVAFAEPLREPDPEVMAQVKSVFVDGLPPHWDEDRVREHFKDYGEIAKIVLARNMSTAKRKDFGFVDFSTHDAAVACIDGINSRELVDGNSKIKVKARLSNPLPKTQAVKGGMCGGFRIGHGVGSSSRHGIAGRGFGRGGYPFNRGNFQSGRGFYQRGRGPSGPVGRISSFNEHNFDNPYAEFHERQFFGRGGRGVIAPSRQNLGRPIRGTPDRGRGGRFTSARQPFSPRGFGRPFPERHFDDPYLYDDAAHGMKRPFYMTDQDPGYMEPSRLRPRLDYSDPALPFSGTRFRDSFGAGSSLYSHDYYGSDYGGGSYSSFYGADPSYGGGY